VSFVLVQLYAPTTLAPARDFLLLRYTSVLEDGSLVVCDKVSNFYDLSLSLSLDTVPI
jgi:homeobox-leucine zipper protein